MDLTRTRPRLLAGALAATLVGGLAVVATPVVGPAVAATPNLYAVVAANGSVVSGSGVVSSTAFGTGQTEVTFDRDVTGCAYLATTVNAGSQAGLVITSGGELSPNGVFLQTKSQSGGLTALPFHLVVACGEATAPFAVVGTDGTLARGSAGTVVTTVGPGQYTVRFGVSVNACMLLATVGDAADSIVIDIGTVSTGLGANIRTAYVETKNLGGGLTPGLPFHLVAFCDGTTGVSGAAVAADGLSPRGFGELSYRASRGKFVAVTRRDVSACATVATRGSLTRDVPFNPATVETTASPAVNTVGFQVRTMLAGGGKLLDESFYTATVC